MAGYYFFYLYAVAFFSETYHESIKYVRQVSGDPVTLHWEDSKNTPDPYANGKRYATNGVKAGQRKKAASEDLFEITQSSSTLLNRLFTQLQNDVSADGLRSVGIYAYIRQQSVPDDLYKFDYETRELVAYPWENAKLKKTRMEALVKAFADGSFIEEAPITLFFTAVLDRAVWRFKEAAYRELELDVGSYVGLASISARSAGAMAIPLGSFVDADVVYGLDLGEDEIPMAAVAVMPKALKKYELASQFAYSSRGELPMQESASLNSRVKARFLLQHKAECITDLSKCVKVFRVQNQAFEGDEFPLTPQKYPNEYFFREYDFLGPGTMECRPFKPWTASLDDFSTLLRWMEICTLNAFGAGLLKIWVACFDVSLVYQGMYRYQPSKKSLYLHAGNLDKEGFLKAHLDEDSPRNAAFAVYFTVNLKDACGIMGDRAYRYLNMNAGYVAEMLRESARCLGKYARRELFFYEDEIKKLGRIPEEETVLCEVLVGR